MPGLLDDEVRTIRCDCPLHPGTTHMVVGDDDRVGRRIEQEIERARRWLSPGGVTLADELRRWSYKPQVWFWIEQLSLARDFPPYDSRLALRTVAVVPDSYNPSRKIEITGRYEVPPWITECPRDSIANGEFARWLQQTLMEMERHESREWLKRDGVLHDDPHATVAR